MPKYRADVSTGQVEHSRSADCRPVEASSTVVKPNAEALSPAGNNVLTGPALTAYNLRGRSDSVLLESHDYHKRLAHMSIAENYQRLRAEIPEHVAILAAAKTRAPEEIEEAVEAGITDIGENYVQEAERMHGALAAKAATVRWHMIGNLQANKINKALKIFDVIQTVDSTEKAEAIDKRIEKAGREVIPVLIEVNIGSEITKAGVAPDYETIKGLTERISELGHLRLEGIMTMGPLYGDPELTRPYFRNTREIFDKISGLNLPGVEMKILSMGMTNSYRVAVQEGSNMIRIGTALFGERNNRSRMR
jgi:pyridoxal phosphate enzyme (YggS family)